jgi:hypothetical protein
MVIEDVELGLKVAENSTESFWLRVRDDARKMFEEIIPARAKELSDLDLLNREIAKMADQKATEAVISS